MRIIVASLEASKHPRALKIAKTLLKHGYEVDIWEAPKIFTRIKHRLVRAFLRYSLAMISLCVKKEIFIGSRSYPRPNERSY